MGLYSERSDTTSKIYSAGEIAGFEKVYLSGVAAFNQGEAMM
jgi:hypothetical protein